MDDDELKEIAKAASEDYEKELASLGELTEDQLDYLSNVDSVVDEDTEVEHDDEPHLTDEEWEYVLAVGEMVVPTEVAEQIRDGAADD